MRDIDEIVREGAPELRLCALERRIAVLEEEILAAKSAGACVKCYRSGNTTKAGVTTPAPLCPDAGYAP